MVCFNVCGDLENKVQRGVMMLNNKSNPVDNSPITELLKKLNAAATRFDLPTLKLSPQNLLQQLKTLKNLSPEEQKQTLQDMLLLLRYEKQIPAVSPNISLMNTQSNALKVLRQLDTLEVFKDKGLSNLVQNIQNLAIKTIQKSLAMDNRKYLKINHYELLKVSPSASLETLKKAKDAQLKQANKKQEKQINQAYKVLSQPKTRLKYDAYLLRQLKKVEAINDVAVLLGEILKLSRNPVHKLKLKENKQKEKSKKAKRKKEKKHKEKLQKEIAQNDKKRKEIVEKEKAKKEFSGLLDAVFSIVMPNLSKAQSLQPVQYSDLMEQ